MAKSYESEVTHFLRTLHDATPDLARRQSEGRALLWDRALDAEQQARWRSARIAQKPYVYLSRVK